LFGDGGVAPRLNYECLATCFCRYENGEDAREAVKALIVANHFLETELETLRASVSTSYARASCCRKIARIGVVDRGAASDRSGTWLS
jgi:hypothetical protein